MTSLGGPAPSAVRALPEDDVEVTAEEKDSGGKIGVFGFGDCPLF